MNFYENHCLPHILNFICGLDVIQKQREKVVPLAQGKILEIGMGSGLNIPFYRAENIELVWGLEPSEGMRKKAQSNLKQAPFEIRWLDLPSEEIPLDNDSVDTVVLTYTLCTIPDWNRALQQMRRVLKPNGKLIFCEHGEAPDENIRRWEEKVNPIWRKVAGGCNLGRPIPSLIEEGGFVIQKLESEYLPGPKFAAFNYWGTANSSSYKIEGKSNFKQQNI
ncbi:MAG: class I SAM-dependent methyltransferase [Gammaproteobacteria bacterium]|nr:class I SAM-dependent methyltransferase [Gammaproteobacteria bacterium]